MVVEQLYLIILSNVKQWHGCSLKSILTFVFVQQMRRLSWAF
jgi:hypothetical protein